MPALWKSAAGQLEENHLINIYRRGALMEFGNSRGVICVFRFPHRVPAESMQHFMKTQNKEPIKLRLKLRTVELKLKIRFRPAEQSSQCLRPVSRHQNLRSH